MKQPAFVGPSYTLQSVNADCQRTINLFPEIDELGTGRNREVASLRHTPGLRKLYGSGGLAPCRGLYKAANGRIFAVLGTVLFELSTAGIPKRTIGTIPGSFPVSFADNPADLVLVNGIKGYRMPFATNVLTLISDPQFPNRAVAVAFLDQFIICNRPDSFQFQISAVNDSSDWSGIDVGSKESHPDNIETLIADHEDLILLGSQSVEFFFNSGNPSFPFERRAGGALEQGIKAKYSLKKIDSTLFWVSQDAAGQGIVVRLTGFRPERVSNFALETAMQSPNVDISKLSAWSYQITGHSFYCLNLPDSTWCYDVASGLWHERREMDRDGNWSRFRAEHHVFTGSTHIVGDFETDSLYELTDEVFVYDDQPRVCQRVAPHFGGEDWLEHRSFRLDMETGVGLVSGQGSDPQVMMEYSDDGGHAWSRIKTASAGKIGERLNRVIFRRLGQARDRVYRVTIADPVKVCLISSFLDVAKVN